MTSFDKVPRDLKDMLPCDLTDMLSLRFDGYAGLRYNIPEDEIGSLKPLEDRAFFCYHRRKRIDKMHFLMHSIETL